MYNNINNIIAQWLTEIFEKIYIVLLNDEMYINNIMLTYAVSYILLLGIQFKSIQVYKPSQCECQ